VEVELFDVDKARACDVVFLAVDGDFALEHAEKICAGEDGAVVIDNSVRSTMLLLCSILYYTILSWYSSIRVIRGARTKRTRFYWWNIIRSRLSHTLSFSVYFEISSFSISQTLY
jgi:hypothetical protein